MIKKTLIVLGILALCFGIFWGTKQYYTWSAKVESEEQSQVLLEKIKTVCKLVTVEGYFSEVYDYKEYWGYDLSPFRKKALIRIRAKVSVGYDLTKMHFETQPHLKKIIISQLPDPEIMSIDHDLDYYDITEGTFNSFSEADYNKMNKNAKEKVRKEANNSDLFLTAEAESAQVFDIIGFMVEGAGWTLEFKPRDEGVAVDTLVN